jgi:hypothetical protein
MTREVYNPKTGIWENGKASPEQLQNGLDKLPSSYVTKDADDPSRIHELDPEHIVGALSDEISDREAGIVEEKPKNLPVLKKFDRMPCSQENIDLIRLRILKVLVDKNFDLVNKGSKPDNSVRHVWFDEDDIYGPYGLRDGNPPPDSDRLPHMRGKSIEIDPCHMPESVLRLLSSTKEMKQAYGEGMFASLEVMGLVPKKIISDNGGINE